MFVSWTVVALWGMQGENPTVYSCALPASLPAPFSVVLGGFLPLFVLVLLYHPFPLLSLSSPLLCFILCIQFLTFLLRSLFPQCRCGLGISDCGWWVSCVQGSVSHWGICPMLLVGVCGWGHHGHGREECWMSPGRKLSCQ